ncbi:hypothetical protein [Vibrio gallaecicus]|uniref:hypothetical protein n=1 Tax=Vibrio gallaecicus TaxID=552386 RepID=UPI0025B5583A|nr:hypothetical protein [Vibrio gallaecicus]MDN3616763.1 hypothetical protein [Vibrio gallaecicus]
MVLINERRSFTPHLDKYCIRYTRIYNLFRVIKTTTGKNYLLSIIRYCHEALFPIIPLI